MVDPYTPEQLMALEPDQIHGALLLLFYFGLDLNPNATSEEFEQAKAIQAGLARWAGRLDICEYGALLCATRYRVLASVQKAAERLEALGLLTKGGANRTALGDSLFRIRKQLRSEFLIEPGMRVYPRTKAGVVLSKELNVGFANREQVGALKGEGVVEEVHDVLIDYSTWPEPYCDRENTLVPHRSCLVRTEDGVRGWVGEGALVLEEEDQL